MGTRIRANAGTMTLVATLVGLAGPTAAQAHIERPAYWPDPAPDTSVSPPAGGRVPTARSLASAVAAGRDPATAGDVRVVCQGKNGARSMRLAATSIRRAQRYGFRLRPSQPVTRLRPAQASRLLAVNRKLRAACRYRSIQQAVTDSGNNDRVVIMPGRYTEPASRKSPTNDPRCNPSLLQKNASGAMTPSYAYQVTCPNDRNLVFVAGRAVVGQPLPEPRADRQGIPEQELGPCLRCNLQIEGSGAKPEDVIIDAGRKYKGRGAEAKPYGYSKDVVLGVDRADGFVGRNFLVRGAREHGFYVKEADGVLLDRMKFFWNADYGHLSFTSDHELVKNCDAMGAGDAALYPGAAPETGSQATSFYPDAPRFNTVITKCDMRNSTLGYSGSMGNAVRITGNQIYGNTTGIASDTLSSAGHPGFPTDSAQIDNNLLYANNFNTYDTSSLVKPLVTVPSGTGVIYAGINDARVFNNWFFDNWRYGLMLFSVPDALTSFGGPEGTVYPGVSCPGAPQNGVSTSCNNRFYNNRMGQVPPGFRISPAVLARLARYKVPTTIPGRRVARNGTDFWWDEFAGNVGNCWYDNTGPDGTPGSVTGPGAAGRMPALPPNTLPDCASGENPEMSVGQGDAAKEQYLVNCSNGPPGGSGPTDCDWYSAPAKPSSRAAAASRGGFDLSPQSWNMRWRMSAVQVGGG